MAKDKSARFRHALSAAPDDGGSPLIALGQRIDEVCKQVGGQTAAATMAGVHPNMMARYRNGQNEPSVLPMVALARGADISLDWLLAGIGPMRRAQVGLDEELLATVVTSLERQLDARRLTLPPQQKGQAVVLSYQLMRNNKAEAQQADAHVGRVLKLVVG